MIKLIVGTKGSGKTKAMIESINAVTKTTSGNVVVLEKSMQLTYNIDHAARLIDLDEYKVNGYEMMYGFVAGVLAGNYDITELYIDGFEGVRPDLAGLGRARQVDAIAASVNVTVTISADAAVLPADAEIPVKRWDCFMLGRGPIFWPPP